VEKFNPLKALTNTTNEPAGTGDGDGGQNKKSTNTTKSPSARSELIAAVRAENWATIGQLGWLEVFQRLEHGWPKKLDAADAEVYAAFLGDYPPALVYDTLVSTPSEWRPAAGQLQAWVAANLAEHTAAPVGDRRAVEAERAAFLNAAALALGETVCECSPRPVDWTKDGRGVLRHDHQLAPGCRGLDLGQVESATEAPDQTPAAYSSAGR
jgi:hypothetical protein